jgi:biopolymer transport protein ExbD
MAGGGGDAPTFSSSSIASQFGTFIPRRQLADSAEFDITAMIDLVFMMNIFFLVTSLTNSMSEVDLPRATYCSPATEQDCIVVTIRAGNDPESPDVFILGESADTPISDPQQQIELVQAAIEAGVREKKTKLLIKADKNIQVRHVVRISSLASAGDGMTPLFAVMETDKTEE